MLDDLLTSCALTLVAAGVVAVGGEMLEAATAPATEPVVATIELPTVVVIGRRDTPPPADVFVAAAGY